MPGSARRTLKLHSASQRVDTPAPAPRPVLRWGSPAPPPLPPIPPISPRQVGGGGEADRFFRSLRMRLTFYTFKIPFGKSQKEGK